MPTTTINLSASDGGNGSSDGGKLVKFKSTGALEGRCTTTFGVKGTTTSGNGVEGRTETGSGVYGLATGNGSGVNAAAGGTGAAVNASNTSTGNLFYGSNGSADIFQIKNNGELDWSSATAKTATITNLGLGSLALANNITTAEVASGTLVTAAEGIASNNNDTTIPTSAAVKAYADSVGGGSGSALTLAVAQASHGLSVGDVVRHNGTGYVTALGTKTNADVVGIVSAVADTGNFTLHMGGVITTLSGLTAGTVYFLSPSAAGEYTATEPTSAGEVTKPLFIAISTTSAIWTNDRGIVIV